MVFFVSIIFKNPFKFFILISVSSFLMLFNNNFNFFSKKL